MKILVTGLNGTLAPVVADHLTQQGHSIISWDRQHIDPDNNDAAISYLNQQQPDAIYHLAMGSVEWTRMLANYAADQQIPFIFTSTAMVFDQLPNGPHHVEDDCTAKDEYGRYKIECEQAIQAVNPSAIMVRIGWQIHPEGGGNNMLQALRDLMRNHGVIKASVKWLPATSFMRDTAQLLYQLHQAAQPGLYQADSNRNTAWNFYQLVQALRDKYNEDWLIEATDDYVHDQRLIDPRIHIADLSSHF